MEFIDVRLAVKRLRARPAAALGACAILIAGIGLATTIFALSDPFLSKPLPYWASERLVLIELDTMRFAHDGPPDYPWLHEWQTRADMFDGLAAIAARESVRAHVSDRVVALKTLAVSDNFFQVLGISATPRPLHQMSPATKCG